MPKLEQIPINQYEGVWNSLNNRVHGYLWYLILPVSSSGLIILVKKQIKEYCD